MPFLVQGIEIVNIGDILRNIGKICIQSFYFCFDIFKFISNTFFIFTENKPGNVLLVQLYIQMYVLFRR